MNAGDTGFMLICTAFVFFMTPGLAFFYGGLVRRKNVVNTMMACGAIMGLSVVMWDHRRFSLGCAEWRRLGAGTLCGYDPASGICGVPDDVCHDHTSTDHWCRGWKNAF